MSLISRTVQPTWYSQNAGCCVSLYFNDMWWCMCSWLAWMLTLPEYCDIFPLESVQPDPHVRKCDSKKFGHPNIYGSSCATLYRDVCPTKAPQWRAYSFCLVDIFCSLLALLILGFGSVQMNNRFCFAWRCAMCTGHTSLCTIQCRV